MKKYTGLMLQGITTKYLSATDFKPQRIKAETSGGNTLTVSAYREDIDQLSEIDAQYVVARELADSLGWNDKLVGGRIKKGLVCVWVFVDSKGKRS